MMRFEYYEPTNIEQAISFANHLPGETKWLAGGTELLPKLKQRAFKADHLINLKKIPELGGISQNDSITRIGSLTTLEELATSKLIMRSLPALSEAAYGVATPNIRRSATIGGNLCQAPNCLYFVHRNLWRMPECFAINGTTCNAIRGARKCTAMSPTDVAPALIALGAELEIKGPKEIKMPLDYFFLSAGITAIGRNEIITSIIIPDVTLQKGSAYRKFSRRKTADYAITSVGVRLVLRPGTDHCLESKIALGGMGPIPVRASKAEEILNEEKMAPAVISKAAEVASQVGQPWTDIHASNYYRRHLAKVLVGKALSVAVIRARAPE